MPFAFPPHEGLPFVSNPPTVDGYVEQEISLPASAQQLEPGYVRGGRFTHAGDSGLPSVVFQGIKHNSSEHIYLGFLVRFDPTFDDQDRIVVILRPTYDPTSHVLEERRIDVLPIYGPTTSGGGGGGAAAVTGDPMMPTDPHDFSDAAKRVRTNRPFRGLEVYGRGTTSQGDGSTIIWSDNLTAQMLPHLEVKVRSIHLNPNDPPTSSTIWGVELKIPATQAGAPGGDWIDLADEFGLYMNVMRRSSAATAASGGALAGGLWFWQAYWPFDAATPTQHAFKDFSGQPPSTSRRWDLTPDAFGQGVIMRPGVARPGGVRFQGGPDGIGRWTSSSAALGSTIDMTLNATNVLAARLINDGDGPADDVTAEFRIADFGVGPYAHASAWAKLNEPGNPTDPNATAADIPVTTGTTNFSDLKMEWDITTDDRDKYRPLWRDQCLWVLLDSASGASFSDSSVRRNMALINLSEAELEVALSAEGGVDKALQSSDPFTGLLEVTQVRVALPEGGWEDRRAPNDDDRRVGKEDADVALGTPDLVTGKLDPKLQPGETAVVAVVFNLFGMTRETVEGVPLGFHMGGFTAATVHALEPGESEHLAAVDVRLDADGLEEVGPGQYAIPMTPGERTIMRIALASKQAKEDDSWQGRYKEEMAELATRQEEEEARWRKEHGIGRREQEEPARQVEQPVRKPVRPRLERFRDLLRRILGR